MHGNGNSRRPSVFVWASFSESWRCATADGAQPGTDDAVVGHGVHKNRECGRADWHDYRRSLDGGYGKAGGGAGDDSAGVDDQIGAWGKSDSRANCRSSEIDTVAGGAYGVQRTHAECGVWRRHNSEIECGDSNEGPCF